MTKPIISLENVSLTLDSKAGPVEILREVSLKVPEGQAVGIVGPSGSGKTTMLMIIAGLEPVSDGDVSIVGAEFSKLGEDALARLRGEHIGIVFQSFHLVPTMTALENVALPLEFSGVDGAREIAKARLDDVGLGHRLDHFPAQLSGGEQQRVAIARAIAPGPKLLLADEPTGNLDGATGAQIMDLLFDLKSRKGLSLVLVTHDPNLAARCDRVIGMMDGRIDQDDLKLVEAAS